MGRYKVVTYPWNLGAVGGFFGGPDPNKPYVKTDTNDYAQATASWKEARSGNYTCVLWDARERFARETFHSGMDGGNQSKFVAAIAAAGVVGVSVAAGVLTLPVGGGAAATAAFSAGGPVYNVCVSQLGAGDALTKAYGLCMTIAPE